METLFTSPPAPWPTFPFLTSLVPGTCPRHVRLFPLDLTFQKTRCVPTLETSLRMLKASKQQQPKEKTLRVLPPAQACRAVPHASGIGPPWVRLHLSPQASTATS